ncbi:zinc finger BED domain-containing protein RICESLEEPER 2-like [Senna tora]|uniref:Zinc finger BED domain-containing protein RICESLEEPER 2-like n=1 Tax=Senna tora TaxID=362788 RepID=A0A834WEV6_9FABA|nr:zinc finger BED domain-containing protein RICESLEEPER 2-like [Senna tora]
MATRMKENFDKYWSDCSVILAIAVVLDPRMKFDALKFCYSKLQPINWEQKLENIKTKLYTLFAQYETRDDGASSSSVAVPPTPLPSTTPLSSVHSKDAYWEYIDYVCETESPVGKSELDKYLEEPMNFQVFRRWHEPITTVASESAFSIGSRVLRPSFSSLIHFIGSPTSWKGKRN